jgi:hypothetical protein
VAERLIIVDPGEVSTRALAPGPNGTADLVELESAAAAIHPRFGEESVPADADVPAIVGMGEGGYVEVGEGAADRAGYEALVGARVTAEKLEAIARAAIFALAQGGDAVRLVLIADPGEKADRLDEVADSLEGVRPISAIPRAGGAVETKRLAIEARCLPAGEALFEWAWKKGAFGPDEAPVVALDMGHRAARLYLLDPAAGLADGDVIPHGGESLLEHARRYARERGYSASDARLLREIRAGVETLTIGGLTFPARHFFALPKEDIGKAIAAAAATRLRRHLERGGRWPRAAIFAGGLAFACGDIVRAKLEERGLSFAKTITVGPDEVGPLLAGALAACARAGAATS